MKIQNGVMFINSQMELAISIKIVCMWLHTNAIEKGIISFLDI